MKLLIDFLQANVGTFEKMGAEKYEERKGFKHDYVYFTAEHKFSSDGNEMYYEGCVFMTVIDKDRSNKNVRIMVSGSFDTMYFAKAITEQEVIAKLQHEIDKHESIHQEKN